MLASVLTIGTVMTLNACAPAGGYTATNRVAAELFGLESGKVYPLVVGDKISGTTGTASAAAGWFYSSASISMQPSSAITVVFKKDDKEWHLEIPTAKITFTINDAAPQTVKMTINENDNRTAARTPQKLNEYQHSACVGTSAVKCDAHLTDEGRIAGLAPIIQQALVGAELTVSQATADQLSGRR